MRVQVEEGVEEGIEGLCCQLKMSEAGRLTQAGRDGGDEECSMVVDSLANIGGYKGYGRWC